MSPIAGGISSIDQRLANLPPPSISGVLGASALPNPLLDVSLQNQNLPHHEDPNGISEPLHGAAALDFMTKRFSQSGYTVKLHVIHDDAYITWCHANQFKGEEIYKRKQGLLPNLIRTRVNEFWVDFKDKNRRGLITIPGIPNGFDIAPLSIEVFDFPPKFANPLVVTFATNHFDDPSNMAYARIVLHFFLEQTFPLGFVSTFSYGGDAPSNHSVTFSYTVTSEQKLSTSMINESSDDTCDFLIIPIPPNMVDGTEPMDLLRCHRKLMAAAGTPHLSLINEDDSLKPQFGVVKNNDSRFHFSFQKMPLLRDSEGRLNFNQWPHYLFTNTLYKTQGGDVREGLYVVIIDYKVGRLCSICFRGTHARSECPFDDCCKCCWESLPMDMGIKEHLRDHCTVLKGLIERDPTIIPAVTGAPTLPLSTSADSTASVLGKRAVIQPVQNIADRQAHKRSRRQAQNAKRSHRRSNAHAAAHAASLAAAAAHAASGAGPSNAPN